MREFTCINKKCVSTNHITLRKGPRAKETDSHTACLIKTTMRMNDGLSLRVHSILHNTNSSLLRYTRIYPRDSVNGKNRSPKGS
jgi:hypothetical protein